MKIGYIGTYSWLLYDHICRIQCLCLWLQNRAGRELSPLTLNKREENRGKEKINHYKNKNTKPSKKSVVSY